MEDQTAPTEPTHGWLQRFVQCWRPKPKAPEPLWRGQCSICNRDVEAMSIPSAPVECWSCLLDLSDESKKLASERRQIELYKIAIREVEVEMQRAFERRINLAGRDSRGARTLGLVDSE